MWRFPPAGTASRPARRRTAGRPVRSSEPFVRLPVTCTALGFLPPAVNLNREASLACTPLPNTMSLSASSNGSPATRFRFAVSLARLRAAVGALRQAQFLRAGPRGRVGRCPQFRPHQLHPGHVDRKRRHDDAAAANKRQSTPASPRGDSCDELYGCLISWMYGLVGEKTNSSSLYKQ